MKIRPMYEEGIIISHMDQISFRKILQRYREGSCSESERKLVDDWLNQLAAHGDGTIHNPMEAKEKFLQNLEATLGSGKSEVGHKTFYKRLAMAAGIAAMLIVAVGVFQQFYLKHQKIFQVENKATQELETFIVNNSSDSKTTHFPDGTDVILYPKSKLTNILFTEDERRMCLEGKAFFKVAPNPKRPFIIITKKLITKVLGTSFTIHAERGEVESVAVRTGKVAVYKSINTGLKNLPGSYVAITPNHQVHFDEVNEKLVTSIIKHPLILPAGEYNSSGKEEEDNSMQANYAMRFEETPVAEILKALEKAYGVKIKYESGEADCIITANLKEEDLFMRLQVVCELTGGSYKVTDDVITVSITGGK